MAELSLSLLKSYNACPDGIRFWIKNFMDKSYTVNDLEKRIKTIPNAPQPKYVGWLIASFEFLQVPQTIEYFLSLKPSYDDVACLIAECEYCHTDEMFKYYISRSPKEQNILWLISSVQHFKSKKIMRFIKELKAKKEEK